jgi:hypothetical protein
MPFSTWPFAQVFTDTLFCGGSPDTHAFERLLDHVLLPLLHDTPEKIRRSTSHGETTNTAAVSATSADPRRWKILITIAICQLMLVLIPRSSPSQCPSHN